MRVLFMMGSGIGNQVETLPALVRCVKEWGDDVVVCNTYPHAAHVSDVIFRKVARQVPFSRALDPNDWDIQVETYLSRSLDGVETARKLKRVGPGKSEVRWNLEATGLDFGDEDAGDCGGAMMDVTPMVDAPDVVIHDGYNRTSCQPPDRWAAKSYADWPQTARALTSKGFSVGSIGSAVEYVPGTVNLTGLNFEGSVAAIRGARVVLANDTGSYHVAAALGVPTVVVFTFTDMSKNYDPVFHRSVQVARREDLPCSPCQFNGKKFWLRNKEKCGWACRNVLLNEVVGKALEVLR